MHVPPWTVDYDNKHYTLVNVILKERGWAHLDGKCEYSWLTLISPIFVIFQYWVVKNVLLNCTFQSLVYDIDLSFFSFIFSLPLLQTMNVLITPKNLLPLHLHLLPCLCYRYIHLSSTIWVHHHLFIHPLWLCISSGLFFSHFSSEIKHLMALPWPLTHTLTFSSHVQG